MLFSPCVKFLNEIWCEEGDLNPHAISGTSPSN
jgi:hypothetical protein